MPTLPLRRVLLGGCSTLLTLLLFLALTLFRVYGVDSHHETRASIWWPERGRDLIPPTARDITLQRDLLDHHATYTVTEKELNAFLDQRFAREGEKLDSFAERGSPSPERIGQTIGPLGWIVTQDTVTYHFTTENGASSTYHHDPTTGSTYQESAYW